MFFEENLKKSKILFKHVAMRTTVSLLAMKALIAIRTTVLSIH